MTKDPQTPDQDGLESALSDAPFDFSAMQLMASRYTLLTELARLLIIVSDVERLTEAVLEKMSAILPFDRCVVAAIDASGQTYRLRTQCETRPGVPTVNLSGVPLTRGVAGRVLRTGRVLYAPSFQANIDSLETADPHLEDGSLRSVLCLPLRSGGRNIGAFALGAARNDAYTSTDVKMARQVADMLALALERQVGVRRQQELDASLTNTSAQLEETVERLEATNLELDTFIYAASHDLRAPLLSIKGLAQLGALSLESGQSAEVADIFERITRNVTRLDGFVEDILQVSRARRMTRQFEETDVPRMVGEVLDSLSASPSAQGLAFRVEQLGPNHVPLERRRVRQILSNLVSNAIKYQNPAAKERYIRVETVVRPRCFELRVADNGIGIPECDRDRIFELFFRASNRSYGAGIGLYLVQQHATAMSADIRLLDSTDETVFELIIPRDAA